MTTSLLRYSYPDGRLQAALPMHVVEDRGDTVVGWTPPGTEILYWATADGRDPRVLPLGARFHSELGTAPRRWTGGGVLRVIPLTECWQAIHFWDAASGEFASWYANLESPKRRGLLPDGTTVLDAVDWHLDLVIDPDRRPSWKDEDEAAAAVGTPYLRSADLAAARLVGERIAADPSAWLEEVGDWRSFRAPEEWLPLALPERLRPDHGGA